MAVECRVARLIPLEKFHFDVTLSLSLLSGKKKEREGGEGEKRGIEGKRYHRSRERKGDIVRKCRGSKNPLFAFSNSPLARSVCQ